MSKRDKIIRKILNGKSVSFEEAKTLMLSFEYLERSTGSHHSFSKIGHHTITLTNKRELKKYQLKLLKEVLKNHGY